MLSAIVISGSALAQNTGVAEATVSNGIIEGWAKLEITSGKWSDGYTISGTNIGLTVTAGARNGSGQGTWTDAQFYWGKLVMNGEEIYVRPYSVDTGGRGPGGMFMSFSFLGGFGSQGSEYQQSNEAPDVRFASNHFTQSGVVATVLKTDVTITFTAKIALIRNGVWDPNDFIDVEVEIKPAAHNRVAQWNPIKRNNGGSWGPPYGGYIRDLLDEARSAFDDSKYNRELMISDNKGNALSDVSESTSAFINAHGTPTHLGDYYAFGNPEPIHWMEWKDIDPNYDDLETAVDLARYQWVFLYSCKTALNSALILDAFNVPAVDGAFLGFNGFLTSEAIRNDAPMGQRYGFAKQAEFLFDRLAEGYTIKKAVEMVNTEDDGYKCLNTAGQPVDMLKHGDDLTTWKSVYLYEDTSDFRRSLLEDSEGRFTNWNIVIE